MPGLHSELTLHKEIINELAAHGWQLGDGSKKAGKYDLKRALYTEDVLTWLTQIEADEYTKIESMHNGSTDAKLLDRLVKVLEQRGTIDVLRKGFSNVNAHFSMCAFKPNTGMNPTELEKSGKVILRVVPELQYSESNENRLDLAFFINGIPVATAELKTDNTQIIDDALRQYRYDRPVKDPKTKKQEPLLTWKRGALVHFAVSSSLVYMTTKLAGGKTYFLPFNRGNNNGAGNPPAEGINYLWEQILDKNAWMEILKSFVCIEKRKVIINGRTEIKETLLFPRYHQWDAVTKLLQAAHNEGPGNRYLVQHSAGSGKSNSIMWLAHRLAHLYNKADKKVFDTVFILTDRNILDEQLADTVAQFDHQAGTIARIDDKGESKSIQLAKALEERAPIVSVTMQTFPFVAKALQGTPAWKGRNFAIIADEAHSSQSGQSAIKIREILGIDESEGEVGSDDVMAAQMKTQAEHQNISYFAFTATPKKKTLELFGRANPDKDGKPDAFHVYSMKQAIQEKFILDVLLNYTTYEMAYKVAKDDKDYDVPKGEAAKLIARMAKLHSYTIGQKVEIIVAHFREVVQPLLKGHAKAMVVTDSREAAVRYKKQMDKHIIEKGYNDLKTLVAFSGEVKIDRDFPGEFTEASMNHLKGLSIPKALDSDEYQVLIVAEKFQTGFDQPLLSGMYVDKKLAGIAAVQTLSRLNRTYNGPFGEKETTYILDFVNSDDTILEAFLPYYETAEILKVTDPNVVHDLIDVIDGYGMPHLYAEANVEEFAQSFYEESKSDNQRQTRLNNLIAPIRDRFLEQLEKSRETNDTQAIDAAGLFRKNLVSYGRSYRFLSQLYNFESVAIGKRELFYDWLAKAIREKQTGQTVDVTGVSLTHLKLTKTFEDKIKLDGKAFIEGGDGVGSAVARIKAYSPLSAVIELMNEFFGADISEENQISMIAGIFSKAIESPTIIAQAENNTFDKFILGDGKNKVKNWMVETHYEQTEQNEQNSRQMDQIKSILSEDEKFEQFASAMLAAIYKAARTGGEPPVGL